MKNTTKELISLEDVTEELVIEYLCTHPEFFQRHEDILESLYIPHPCGDAVSLIERQTQLLREKNQQLQQDAVNILQIAKANEALLEATKRLTISMLRATTLAELVDSINESLCLDLKADVMRVGLTKLPKSLSNHDCAFALKKSTPAAIKDILKIGQPVCKKLAKEQKQFFFADKSKEVASCALIPLGEAGEQGLIVIGSHDGRRFHKDMDTLFLDYIGKICSKMLAKF